MSIALFLFITSLLLPSLSAAVLFTILCVITMIFHNKNPYKLILINLIMIVSSLQPHFKGQLTGIVVSNDENLYRIITVSHSVSVVTDEKLDLDVVVSINGEYKVNDNSNKKRYQTFYNPKVTQIARLPSFKRGLWNYLKDRPKLQSIIFSKFDENESLLASQGWYISGFLKILEWLFKPIIGSGGVKKLRKSLLSIYFFVISQSIPIFRLLIGSFFRKETQIIIILCLFPRLSRSGFFYLIYGPWIFESLHSKLNEHVRIIRFMILSTFLNRLNFIEILTMPALKIYAGVQYIFALLAVVITFIPYEFPMIESNLLTIKRLPLEIVGHVSIICILIYCFLAINKKNFAYVWLVLVYSFVIFNPITTVTFIDVGQGDASLIKKSFNQRTVLIDTGKPSAYMSLQRELQRKGVKNIDALVITHDDLDHSGNYDRVMIDYKVSRSIREKNEKMEGYEFFLENRDFGNPNDNSLILKSCLSVMFTGDAGILQEFILSKDLNTQSRILKLGHHGSKTSSSKNFLLHVRPSVAIISSDPKSYGHPHKEVLKNLYDSRIPYLQTSKEGSITFYFIGHFIFYSTENGRIGIV